MLALMLVAQFFEKPGVEFWNKPRPTAALRPEELFGETTILPDGRIARTLPPPEVLELLMNPAPEKARRYLALQEERLARVRRALEAVQAEAARRDVEIFFYSLPGCPACEIQKKELKGAAWRIRELPATEEIAAVPTLVVRWGTSSTKLAGVQTQESIRRAIEKLKREERHD